MKAHLQTNLKKPNSKLSRRIRQFALVGLLGLFQHQALAQVSVSATVGTATGTYTTVNDAFTAINAGTHKGVINITVTGNTTEPATPVPLLKSDGTTSSYTAITIKPSGNVTINSNASAVTNRGIIELAGADNVTIDGDDPLTAGTQNMSIVAATSSTAGIACIRLSSNSTTGTDGADNITVKNCTITGSRNSATSTVVNYGIQFSNGVAASSASTGAYASLNTLIQNNIITRCYYGINAIGGSSTYLLTGLQILNNTIGSATASDYVAFKGIALSNTATTAGSSSAIIRGNDVRTGHTAGNASMSAIEVGASNAGIQILSNNIHDCINPTSGVWGMYGIGIISSTSNANIMIANNFIRDIAGYTVSSTGNQYGGWGIYVSGDATNINIIHNTIAQQVSTVIGGCIFLNSSGATVAKMLNNILVNNVASQYSVCIYNTATANISAGTVNNNNYYINTTSGNLGYYGATIPNLVAWQTATSKDALAKNELPPFVSATDLHLTAGANTFLESGGATVATTGISNDIDGQTRPGASTYGYGTAPDIGADEFDGKAACATLVAATTTATPNSNLCMGSTVTFALSAAQSGPGIVYNWQSSSNGTTYSNISGANSSTLTTAATANYYRCKISCASGTDSLFSTPVQLNYTNNILSANGAVRCGAGTVNLTATANTGATIRWYTAPTGGASIGSGSPFTTPSIAATTNFYASSEVTTAGTSIIGNGATTNATYPNPYYSNWSNTHNQYLITAAELQAAGLAPGNITSLGIKITSGTTTLQDVSIKMAHTTATNMSAFVAPTFTSVYTAATLTPVVGINTMTFTTPFNWDGTSNVVIEFCHGNGSSTATISSTAEADNTSYVSTIHVHKTAATTGSVTCTDLTTNLTTYSVRPRFYFAGQTVCASARTAVAATVNTAPAFDVTNDKTVCNNAITPLTVNSTQSSYNNVTWSPVTNLFTDAAATVAYTAGTHAYTVYQKSATAGLVTYIATANNTSTLCGAVDTAKIQTLPTTTTAIAATGVLCNSGSSVINLNPAIAQTGVLYQWQNSTDNSTFTNIATNGTSATYTTSSITATQYYRAVIKNSDNVVCFNSVSDTVLVNNPQLLTTTPATRCGIGPVTLSATTNANASAAWYAAATGGAALATGNSFTTPSLAATTNYWVSARASGSTAGSAQVGTGTDLTTATEELTAFCNRRVNYRMQMIFTAAELNALGIMGGNINGIGFNITTLGDAASNANYTIKMGTTTQSTFSTYITTGLNTVYGPINYTHAVGNNNITFTTPFVWDGASNIVVEVTHDGIDNINNAQTYYTTTSSAMLGYSYNSSTTATTSTKRLNTTFFYQNLCESPRQQVTATVTPAPAFDITNDKTACNNGITTLTVNSPAANFNNVTWTPIANLYTNAAATTPYTAGTNASTVYYKSSTTGITTITANALNTTSQCANLDTIKIQTLPASVTAVAAPDLICQSGTSTVTISPAITQTGMGYQWQNSTDNVTFTDIATGGTGASYTTPTITATRYYRVTVKNSDGAVCFNSVKDTVVVNNPQILTTAPASRCGPGTLTLGATANTNGQIKWYSAATGGTALATGPSFTTPSLAATTNYFVASEMAGPGPATVGAGATTSTTYPNPFYSLWSNTHNQYLIPATELQAAGLLPGNITSLAIKINSGTLAMQDFSIKMAHTSATNMSAFVAPTFTTVYTATTQTPVVGVNTMNFTTPFNWDGTSNVVIEICHGNSGSSATMSSSADVDNTAYVSTIHVHKSTSSAGAATCTDLTTNLTTYSIRPKFTFSGQTISCVSTRTQVTATVNPKPTAGLSPTGTINICDGASQTLTATGSGNYSWLKNNILVPGQTGNTLAVNQTGGYKVVVTNTSGCSDTSVAANVTVNPKPVVNLGNDTAVCANVPLTLNAGNPGAAYLWNDNSTNSTLVAAAAGQYRVKVTNSFNCSTSDTINIAHKVVPVVNLGNDTMICHVQPLTLNAANPGAAYLWNTGATSQTISVNQAGTYSVSVTNASNCTGTDAIAITIMPQPVNDGFNFVPLFNEAMGKVRFEPINPAQNYTYAWNFGDGATSTLDSPVHTFAAAGDYLVTMDVSNGCTDTSVTLLIRVDFTVGTATVVKNNIDMRLYPNPAQDQLKLELVGDNIYFRNISVHNVVGQKVIDLKTQKTVTEKINLSQLPAGMYILKAETDKGMVMRKFEVIK
jgi:hypothetical protein